MPYITRLSYATNFEYLGFLQTIRTGILPKNIRHNPRSSEKGSFFGNQMNVIGYLPTSSLFKNTKCWSKQNKEMNRNDRSSKPPIRITRRHRYRQYVRRIYSHLRAARRVEVVCEAPHFGHLFAESQMNVFGHSQIWPLFRC